MIHKNNKQVKLIVGKYKAGKKTGEWTDYDENGAVNAKGIMTLGNGITRMLKKERGVSRKRRLI